MIIKFIVEIEVEDELTPKESRQQATQFDSILADMEEIVAKQGFDVHDQEWVAIA